MAPPPGCGKGLLSRASKEGPGRASRILGGSTDDESRRVETPGLGLRHQVYARLLRIKLHVQLVLRQSQSGGLVPGKCDRWWDHVNGRHVPSFRAQLGSGRTCRGRFPRQQAEQTSSGARAPSKKPGLFINPPDALHTLTVVRLGARLADPAHPAIINT